MRVESPPPRTKWTRPVPHPVLIGHAASLTPYESDRSQPPRRSCRARAPRASDSRAGLLATAAQPQRLYESNRLCESREARLDPRQ